MTRLWMDFETRSELEIDERGLHNYAEHPSTAVLMLAWAVDDDEIQLERLMGDPLPDHLLQLIRDSRIAKCAWNASFERTILRTKCGVWVPYEQWYDPMAHSRQMSMPGKLEDVCAILKLPVELAKFEDGKALIKKFCMPVVPAREGGLFGSTPAVFRDHRTDPADWARFEDYCKQDLVAERTVAQKLAPFPIPETEKKLWYLDQSINDTGVPIDMAYVAGSAAVAEQAKAEMTAQLQELTHLENVNSRDQVLAFVEKEGYPFSSLGKAMVARALAGEGSLTALGKEVLTLRQQSSKTASAKLLTIRDLVSSDGRLRDAFSFLGAARTGRWSAHGFQPHNFPRPSKEVEKNYPRALELLRAADYEAIKREFSSPIDVVGSCLRSTVVAPEGFHFDVCDLSAIEPRVTAVVSDCKNLLEVFRTNRDVYLDFGSRFYKKPYDAVTHRERQISKPAVLGCCYQMSGGKEVENKDGDIIKTGLWGYAESMGVEMTQEQAAEAVAFYRKEYPEVPACWKAMERAAIAAIQTRQSVRVGPIMFQGLGQLLRVLLPSGRSLYYVRPQVRWEEYEGWDGETKTRAKISYEGVDSQTHTWARLDTFGGHFFENIVQAIARDVLALGMIRASEVGFVIVGHIHDEIITLTPDTSKLKLDDLRACMVQKVEWMPSLLLDAAGYSGREYKKE